MVFRADDGLDAGIPRECAHLVAGRAHREAVQHLGIAVRDFRVALHSVARTLDHRVLPSAQMRAVCTCGLTAQLRASALVACRRREAAVAAVLDDGLLFQQDDVGRDLVGFRTADDRRAVADDADVGDVGEWIEAVSGCMGWLGNTLRGKHDHRCRGQQASVMH
jgi:hypothetical protein